MQQQRGLWNGGQPNKRRAVGAYPMVEDLQFLGGAVFFVEQLIVSSSLFFHFYPLPPSVLFMLLFSSCLPILILLYSLPVGCEVTVSLPRSLLSASPPPSIPPFSTEPQADLNYFLTGGSLSHLTLLSIRFLLSSLLVTAGLSSNSSFVLHLSPLSSDLDIPRLRSTRVDHVLRIYRMEGST